MRQVTRLRNRTFGKNHVSKFSEFRAPPMSATDRHQLQEVSYVGQLRYGSCPVARTTSDAGHVVECERADAQAVVLEVELQYMLARR
jgi:hypothetical protein